MRRVAVLAGALLFLGCGNDSVGTGSAKSGGPKQLKIAVIPKGLTHEFWKSIHAGAAKAAEELGNVKIFWNGPATESDAPTQIRMIEDFVTQKVDAIVLAPLDRRSIVGAVEGARAAKIPVVIIDSELDSKDIIAYVATDNYNGGKIAGEYMAKILNGEGNVVVLRYQVGSASTEQRENGFIDAIKKSAPKIKILTEGAERYAGATEASALKAAEDIVTLNGGKVNGWFCPCEPVTSGTIVALENAKLAGKVKVVGFDAGSKIVPAFKQGYIHGLILQDPVNMGYLGVKTAVAAIQGKPVEPKVGTGENLVTPENFEKPNIQALLKPDIAKYLKE